MQKELKPTKGCRSKFAPFNPEYNQITAPHLPKRVKKKKGLSRRGIKEFKESIDYISRGGKQSFFYTPKLEDNGSVSCHSGIVGT